MLVLSIDGGGIRGLIAATILERLEALAGKPIREIFAGVAGTSTGGIIACAVAAGIPMSKVKALYREKAEIIFDKDLGHELLSLGGMTDEKYSPAGLESCLLELFGDIKLSEVPIRLLVPSCDISGKPTLFRSEAAKHDAMFNFYLRDVCRATSAAPTYFPPAIIRSMAETNTLSLMDGGLAANQPAMCALIDAMSRAKTQDITLVSIGTGWTPEIRTVNEAENCGLLSGGLAVLRLLFDGPGLVTDWQCSTLLGQDRYIRLQPMLPKVIDLDAIDEHSLTALEFVGESVCSGSEFAHVLALAGVEQLP